jgi:cation transport ATPase
VQQPECGSDDDAAADERARTRETVGAIIVLAIATAVLMAGFSDLRLGTGPKSLPVWFVTATLAAALTLQMTIVSQWPDFDRRYAAWWLRGSPSINVAFFIALVAFFAGVLLERR